MTSRAFLSTEPSLSFLGWVHHSLRCTWGVSLLLLTLFACRDLRKALFGRYKRRDSRSRSRSPKYVMLLPQCELVCLRYFEIASS